MKGMRILVTGGTGYVGRAVVRELQLAGHAVVALDRQAGRDLGPDVEARWGDVLDEATIREAVRGVDGVCHLAALARVREAAAYPAKFFRVNAGGTLNLLEALAEESAATGTPARLVFASTGGVYDPRAAQPIGEDAAVRAANPYASSKIAAEQLIGWQAATGVLGAVTLRLFNAAGAVDGAGDPDLTRILPRSVEVAAGRASHVDVNGDGTAVRDFVHVLDAGRAFALALGAADPGRHLVFNVGATPASVRDIAAAVARAAGRPVPLRHGPAYAGEAARLVADTTAIRTALGWRPERSTLDYLVRDQWAATGG